MSNSNKKKREEIILEEILGEVKSLKSTTNSINNKIENNNEKMAELDNKIKSINRQFKISSDDQVFLGFILAFITVFLSIQVGDIANFFNSVHSSTAVYSANVLKWGSLGFLIISTAQGIMLL